MTTVVMEHNGRPVFVRGFTAVYNSPSVPLDRCGGRREIVRPGAFARQVAVPPRNLVAAAYHLDGPGFASVYARNLSIWETDFGLAFQAGPIPATPVNASIIAAIVSNQMRGCSWLATAADSSFEVIDGEAVHVIRRFETVDHIGPVDEGAYPAACCWCSHEGLYDVPWQIAEAMARWTPKPAARPTTPARPVAQRMAATAKALRAPTAAPTPPEEWAGPPPPGMSMSDWLNFAAACDHGARAARHQNRARRVRQA